ncbi:Uncaracterized surface protein containing fasciclin (FAS1) repeats [Flavobacteriaceae bacterium MAR_2010_188]|nr:Uncaracterized surface protein containing fasciclin (FAS1) repeats [Flavobacteriaceae bacterium MAR_2010_188]
MSVIDLYLPYNIKTKIMNFYKNKTLLTVGLVSLLAFASCDDSEKKQAEMEKEKTELAVKEKAEAEKVEAEAKVKEEEMKMEARSNSIAGLASNNAELKTLTAGLKAAKLDSMLAEPGDYTVFAPTENAFSKLPQGTLDNLLKEENKEQLKSVLQYHVVAGNITTYKLTTAIKGGNGKYTFNTVTGAPLTVSMNGDQIVIQDGTGKKAHIVQGNVNASNGTVYLIDRVLMAKK